MFDCRLPPKSTELLGRLTTMECWPWPNPQLLLSLAVALAVVALLIERGFDLKPLEYMACLTALIVALVTVHRPAARGTGTGVARALMERFQMMAHKVIVPSLDNVVRSWGSGGLTEEEEQQYRQDEGDTIDVNQETMGISDENEYASMLLKYKQAAFFLCQLRTFDRSRYESIMTVLRAPAAPPPTHTPGEDDEDYWED